MLKENKFSKEVIDELKYYVYKLIDPRNGEVFYVGKGKGNRVFSHARGVLAKEELEDWQDDESEKIKTIREIKSEGLDVIYIIHRHHMDEKTAFEVEAALIDAYPGLTNIASPVNCEYGVASVEQIVARYGLPQIDDFKKEDKVLIIKIKQENVDTWGNGSIYETVRKWWKLNGQRRNKVKQVAAVIDGVVKGVYRVEKWFYNENKDKWGFEGEEIIDSEYLNKRIPSEKYRKKGQASPTIYTFE